MAKEYIKPQMNLEEIEVATTIAVSSLRYRCTNACRIWHCCTDKREGKFCFCKEY